MEGLDKAKADREYHPCGILETDICDWCRDGKAIITDGTYVYCSDNCKQLFVENALQAIEDAMNLYGKESL